MIRFETSELQVLDSRLIVLETKIAEERIAMSLGTFGPSGNPLESPAVSGETRIERISRWEDIAKAIKRSIAAYRT